jgi:hypothetical protein
MSRRVLDQTATSPLMSIGHAALATAPPMKGDYARIAGLLSSGDVSEVECNGNEQS